MVLLFYGLLVSSLRRQRRRWNWDLFLWQIHFLFSIFSLCFVEGLRVGRLQVLPYVRECCGITQKTYLELFCFTLRQFMSIFSTWSLKRVENWPFNQHHLWWQLIRIVRFWTPSYIALHRNYRVIILPTWLSLKGYFWNAKKGVTFFKTARISWPRKYCKHN